MCIWHKLCTFCRMKASQAILTIIFLMTITLCSAQDSKIENAQSEIAYNGDVWVADDSARMHVNVVVNWITDELDLVVSKKLKKIQSLSSVPQNGQLSEIMNGDTVVLAQPFLSCGIGHNLYKLVSETPDKLVFEEFWGFTGINTGKTLVFRKKT